MYIMKTERIVNASMVLSIAAVLALAITGCQKEEPEMSPTSVSGPQPVMKLCPQQTVDYTALAQTVTPPTPPTGQLNTVYQQCLPVGPCSSFYNQTSDVHVRTEPIESIIGPGSLSNVTYAQQVAIINYFKNIAIANAPICSGTTKKVLKTLKFYRDPLSPTAVAAYAIYACCGPNPE
jgi:hypothetical protein